MSDAEIEMVRASNALTAAWIERLRPGETTVVSGAGAWGLLSLLLVGADGDAQRELEAATHQSLSNASTSLARLLDLVGTTRGVQAAVGLWTHPEVNVLATFLRAAIGATVGQIPARADVLDQWARDNTDGIINTFPGTVLPTTRLVAAVALAAVGDWSVPFSPGHGHWLSGPESLDWLYRNSGDLDAAALITGRATTISRVVCETTAGFDVHLVAGDPGATPAVVLRLALDAIDGHAKITVGSALRPGDHGGCLTVENRAAFTPEPHLAVGLPVFEVEGIHDLLQDAAAFGLQAARDTSTGHFPALSSFPLAIESVAQAAFAGFSATGFKAAAVTSAMAVAGAGLSHNTTVIRATFDRPFGFVVVERDGGLVLFAGWITSPIPSAHTSPAPTT